MKKFYFLGGVLFIIILFYFVRSIEPLGLYVAKHNKYTIDSLWIEKKYYKRFIYDAKSGELLFSNKNKWMLKDKRLIFYDFFPNDDETLNSNYDFNSVLITFSVPLEKSLGQIVFDYDIANAKYRFYKQW